MFQRSSFLYLLLIALLAALVLPGMAVFADDVVPTIDVAASINGTPVDASLDVTPPAPATDTAEVPDNPRGGPSFDAYAPYLRDIGITVVIAVFSLFGLALVLVYRGLPPWAKAVIIGAGDALVKKNVSDAAATPDPYDDQKAARLEADWEKWKADAMKDVENIAKNVTIRTIMLGQDSPASIPDPDAPHQAKLTTEGGQGLVEYALILVLVAVVVIVILALMGPAIGNIFSTILRSLDPNALPPGS